MTLPHRTLLDELLAESARRHQHLCPRQVLGVRLALIGLQALDLSPAHNRAAMPGETATHASRFRNDKKRLLCIVETDGCGADGVAVATDCTVGKRTLRVLDYGKVAATLVDCHSGRAVRVAPAINIRRLASDYAPGAASQWHAYLTAYQTMPDEALATVSTVRLTQSLEQILSRPDARVCCVQCGEEIFNERETYLDGEPYCRHCAGEVYYEEI